MSADKSVPLPELGSGGADLDLVDPNRGADHSAEPRAASDLEAVFDVPVAVSAVLGRARLEVAQLMRLKPGAVIELDRKIGEAIDIYVNDRLVARGEVVLVEERLGVTMTEIIKPDRA
jgi:flagellar motor switch protein FliN/FliY